MLMPDPDQNVIDRRDDICAALRKLVPVECVIDSKESMKAFDADGLSAYRQLPLAVVLPETVEQIAAVMVLVRPCLVVRCLSLMRFCLASANLTKFLRWITTTGVSLRSLA